MRNLTYVARSLRRDLTFPVFVVIALALGIGLNAVIYGIADRLLFRGPAGVADESNVIRLYHTDPDPGQTSTSATFDYPAYDGLQRNLHSFSSVAGYAALAGTLGRGRDAKAVNTGYASGTFFGTLGVRCPMGRCLAPIDTIVSAVRPVVLGFGLWQTQFGGAKDVVGRTILIDDTPVIVVGVAPKGFSGAELTTVDVWLPIDVLGARLTPSWKTQWDGPWMMIVGRLRPKVSREQAMAEATAVFRRIYTGEYPPTSRTTISQAPLTFNWAATLSDQAVIAKWLVILALVVLLLACSNVTNLMLARVSRRRQEIVVRRALGASWMQIFGLFLAEGILLSGAGGLVALLVAAGGTSLVRNVFLAQIAWPSSILDARVIYLCGAVAAAIGLFIGIAPVMQALRFDVTQGLKAHGGNRLSGSSRAGQTGIAIQCGLSTVLLICAALFVVSLRKATAIDYGVVQPKQILVVSVNWPRIWTPDDEGQDKNVELNRRLHFLESALTRIEESPFIDGASLGTGMPMFYGSNTAKLRLADTVLGATNAMRAPHYAAITPGYFKAVGTRLERGRLFTTGDRQGAEPVAIVNDTMARTFWKTRDPVGQCLVVGDNPACTRIVGVTANSRTPGGNELVEYYLPLAQAPGRDTPRFFVRPRGNAAAAARGIRDVLLSMDGSIDYIDIKTLQQSLDPATQPTRLGALLFGSLAALALLIGAVGLYSNVFYAVERRRREIAIRVAVGASRSDVVTLVMSRAMIATVMGTAAGLAVVWIGRQSIKGLLFKTSPGDPAVILPVVVVLMVIAIAATLPSVFRSNRIDPIEVLRAD